MLVDTYMSASRHILRSLRLGLLVVGSLVAAGCAAPSADAEDVGASGADAITRDERVTRYAVRNFASSAPSATGVDAWDYAVVENAKTGKSYPVLIALSTRSGKAKPLFELALVDGGESQIQARAVDAEGTALSLRRERLAAIQTDVEKMADALSANPMTCDNLQRKLLIGSIASFAVALGAGALCVAGAVSPAAPIAYPVCYAAIFGGGLGGMWSGAGAAYCAAK
jgi:hypothetical protein